MVPSLNTIAASLASRAGEPFNVSLQKELKHIFVYKAGFYLAQYMEEFPVQREIYSQDIIFALADEALIHTNTPIRPDVEQDCKVYITACDIPKPMRTSHDLFLYVGGVNGMQPFQYWPLENAVWLDYNRYTKNRPKYDYINNRITIYYKSDLRNVRARTVWEDPYSFSSVGCATAIKCPNEDSPVPYPEDIINTVIREILTVELGKPVPDEQDKGVVKTDVKENVPANRQA